MRARAAGEVQTNSEFHAAMIAIPACASRFDALYGELADPKTPRAKTESRVLEGSFSCCQAVCAGHPPSPGIPCVRDDVAFSGEGSPTAAGANGAPAGVTRGGRKHLAPSPFISARPRSQLDGQMPERCTCAEACRSGHCSDCGPRRTTTRTRSSSRRTASSSPPTTRTKHSRGSFSEVAWLLAH